MGQCRRWCNQRVHRARDRSSVRHHAVPDRELRPAALHRADRHPHRHQGRRRLRHVREYELRRLAGEFRRASRAGEHRYRGPGGRQDADAHPPARRQQSVPRARPTLGRSSRVQSAPSQRHLRRPRRASIQPPRPTRRQRGARPRRQVERVRGGLHQPQVSPALRARHVPRLHALPRRHERGVQPPGCGVPHVHQPLHGRHRSGVSGRRRAVLQPKRDEHTRHDAARQQEGRRLQQWHLPGRRTHAQQHTGHHARPARRRDCVLLQELPESENRREPHLLATHAESRRVMAPVENTYALRECGRRCRSPRRQRNRSRQHLWTGHGHGPQSAA